MSSLRSLTLVALALAASGCSSYTSAIGFRARRAVMEGNVEVFQELMVEASESRPMGPRDNPKKTVLTHFLDLASDSRFFPYIEGWRKQGWVGDDMICSIHRAHYRAVQKTNPEAAQRSIDVCLATARDAAEDPEKSWQVKDCLEEAAFLTQTSTTSLVQFVQLVADPTEPIRFRVALLEGMSRIPVSGPQRRLDNDSSLTREQAFALAEEQLGGVQKRFEWIVAAARPFVEVTLLAAGTAMGAMEIEEASIALGRSYIGPFALGENPDDNDLAWSWVRSMKPKKKIPSLQSLGIWSRDKETREDVYWYMCARPAAPPKGSPAGSLGPMTLLEAISIRTSTKTMNADELRNTHCVDKKTSAVYPTIVGPFPLESIGRGMISGLAAKERGPGQRTSIVLRRRILL